MTGVAIIASKRPLGTARQWPQLGHRTNAVYLDLAMLKCEGAAPARERHQLPAAERSAEPCRSLCGRRGRAKVAAGACE